MKPLTNRQTAQLVAVKAISYAYEEMVRESCGGKVRWRNRERLASVLRKAARSGRSLAHKLCALLGDRLDDRTVIHIIHDLQFLDAAADYVKYGSPSGEWSISRAGRLNFK